ncbi:Uncharacterised protein [Mycobacteroides abscessus subsp. abscessus]|nr:Uncharacterised protein [Mycobacteroides abscessus subsp. abscessus]
MPSLTALACDASYSSFVIRSYGLCGIDDSGKTVAPFINPANLTSCSDTSLAVYLSGSTLAVNDTALSAQHVWYIAWNANSSFNDNSSADCTNSSARSGP